MAAAKPAVAAALSAERQALSDAQERLRQHDAEIVSLRENYEIRSGYLSECWDAVNAAENEIQEVTLKLRNEHRLKGPMGRAMTWTPAPEPPEQLIEALQAARQRQVEAETACAGIQAELDAAEEGRKRLHDDTDRAAWIVQAAHARDIGLAAETERKQREAYDNGLKLMLLYKVGVIEAKPETLGRVEAYSGFWDLDDLTGARSWADAHERLMSDPTAEIP